MDITYRTVTGAWLSFNADVLGNLVDEKQREDCRKSFYAGGYACFRLAMDALEAGSTQQVKARVGKIAQELQDFVNEGRID